MRLRILMMIALAALLLPEAALAGIAYPTNVAGTFADAAVNLQCDASGINCQPVTTANPVPVAATGNVAAGATDSGNPVKVGAIYNATRPTYTTGQRGDLQVDTRGSLGVALFGFNGATGVTAAAPSSDGFATSNTGLATQAFPYAFNGTTLDRVRGDTNGLVVQPGLSSTYWSYASAAGGIVSSTADVAIAAARGASVRNYVKSLTISHDTLSAATEIVVKDGATVIYRGKLQTAAIEGGSELIFDPPLRGTANTAVNVALISSVTGGVFVNATGWTGN